MFGFFSSKPDKQKKPNNKNGLQASTGCELEYTKRDESQRIRKEALASSRKARAHIGEETLQKISKTMEKMHQDPLAKAKMRLQGQDKSRMHDIVRDMMGDKD